MTAFEVWAAHASDVAVVVEGASTPLRPTRPGWWGGDVPALMHGADYAVVLDGGDLLPDPRSRHLPHGVHGPSRWWDPASAVWTDDAWRGRPLRDGILEVHVGTFTREGTLDAAIGRLDHVAALGVGFVELLPVAAFDGDRGWGYDGVAPWSVHEAYGGPDALCRFVDAAHARGLGVLLDVVHNHLGPSGNYLGRFGPWFTEHHHTPWGAAVNLDLPGSDDVREQIVGSVLALLHEHHLDGLRLDAVHELRDDRAVHLLEELSSAVQQLSHQVGRPLHLVAESDRNDPRTVLTAAEGGLGMTAQWDDDVHHALHVWLTGESAGYYADFAEPGAAVKTLRHGFLHDGRWSSFRGRSHGRPIPRAQVEPWQLVASLQTHDQVGNRAEGDRLGHLVRDPGVLAAGAALLLCLPYTPMLFMGEEWAASTPWPFFTSFPDRDLGRAVSEGRRAEMAGHGGFGGEVPDPQDPATFERSRLDWDEADHEPHASVLRWYRDLLFLRRHEPDLYGSTWDFEVDDVGDALVLRRGGIVVVAARADVEVALPRRIGEVLLAWPSVERSRDGATVHAVPGALVARIG